MYLYKDHEIFSRTTGKSVGTQKFQDGIVCDFCGRKIKETDPYENPGDMSEEISLSIHSNSESEHFFEFETVDINGKRLLPSVLYAIWNHNKFYYCKDYDVSHFCEAHMLEEFSSYGCIHDMMWAARLSMLKRKIEDGTYTFEDFDLYVGN